MESKPNQVRRDARGWLLPGSKLALGKRKVKPLVTESERRKLLEIAKEQAFAGSGYHLLALVHLGELSPAARTG
ncbi:MAG: hypothetical protein M5U26_29200 [Planctomycetota bacterium]|nr:hypothetical protein [Planctomycetota bacterium]